MKTRNDSGDATRCEAMDEVLRESLGRPVPPEVLEDAKPHFASFRRRLAAQSASRRKDFPRFAWAGAGALATLAAVAFLVLVPSAQDVTWAQVVEQFKAAQRFGVTVYLTEDPLEPPERLEIWVGGDRRLRLHHAGHVFFAVGEEVTDVFDARTRQRLEPGDMDRRELREAGLARPLDMIRMMGAMDGLSLDNLLALFCGRKALSEPIPNATAGVAEHLEVFDVKGDRTPEWLRIWVLPGSNLPLRLRAWDPRDGDCVEVLFDYTQAQPEEAFDPRVYEQQLKTQDGRANRLYFLLKDPGGRALTPDDLFRETGYHLPTVREVGRTTEGVVWVRAGKAKNRMPDGRVFYGFGKLEDNLGQEYLHRWVRHQTREDVSLEYFVPLDYGTDFRMPSSYTLTCWTQPDHYTQPADVVGSVAVTNWQERTEVPGPWAGRDDRYGVLFFVIDEQQRRENWDRVDRLLDQIPGEPEESDAALFRERKRLRKWAALRDAHPDAGWSERIDGLAARLYAIVRDRFMDDPRANADLVGLLARSLLEQGRYEATAGMLRRHTRELSASDNREAAFFLSRMAAPMLRSRAADFGDLEDLFEYDFLNDADVMSDLEWVNHARRPRPETNPRFDAWRAYVAKIADRYKDRTLPDAFEVLEEAEPFEHEDPYAWYRAALPGHPGYSVFIVGRDGWHSMLYSLALDQGYTDLELVRLSEAIPETGWNRICVARDDLSTGEVYDALRQAHGLTWIDVPLRRTVWVARYDGRPLPYWRDVRPLEAEHLGQPAERGGGTSTNIRRLFEVFQRAINHGREGGPLAPGNVYLVDETGLPTRPGPNQTSGSICISYSYAFWTGEEGVELARDWFRDTFGITFHEEERELVFHELRAARDGA